MEDFSGARPFFPKLTNKADIFFSTVKQREMFFFSGDYPLQDIFLLRSPSDGLLFLLHSGVGQTSKEFFYQ